MDFKLAMLLLAIGLSSSIISICQAAKELTKAKERNKKLRKDILANVGVTYSRHLKKWELLVR